MLYRALSILAVVCAPLAARGATIGFDDATSGIVQTLNPGSYAGFTWTNTNIYRQDYFQSTYSLPSGLDNGVVSGTYAAANRMEGYAIVQNASPFAFLGGDFTSLGKNNARITVEGYKAGDTLGGVSTAGAPSYTYSTMFSAGSPTHVAVDFPNVVAVKFLAFRWDDAGTTTNAYGATYGDFFVLDNMVVAVPEPAAWLLMIITALTAVLLPCQRRNSVRCV